MPILIILFIGNPPYLFAVIPQYYEFFSNQSIMVNPRFNKLRTVTFLYHLRHFILSTISTSLIVAFVFHKIAKIPTNISTLVGVGSSICGGSAIAATAPVIEAKDEEVAQAISVIFLFNIIAALIFPTLGSMLGLSNDGFGLFAGTAINDTSSVTAAAAAWDGMHAGANTLDYATIVKLTRTLAIIPITLVLALYRTRKAKQGNAASTFSLKKVFPFFILFFV